MMEKNFAFAIGDIGNSILAKIAPPPTYIDVFLDWERVVGSEISEISSPHKILTNGSNKVLVIKVKKGKAVELQHESRRILEKVHNFLDGATVFSHLKIIQMDFNEQLTS